MTPEFYEAYHSGWLSWEDGEEPADNPYHPKRERTRHLAWNQGWREREMRAQEQARQERRKLR